MTAVQPSERLRNFGLNIEDLTKKLQDVFADTLGQDAKAAIYLVYSIYGKIIQEIVIPYFISEDKLIVGPHILEADRGNRKMSFYSRNGYISLDSIIDFRRIEI